MAGKIFPGSASIYEDQAKILFDYYHRIATGIVEQEEALEKQTAVAREEQVQFAADIQKKSLIEKISYGAAVALAVGLFFLDSSHIAALLGVAPAFYGLYLFFQRKKLAAELAEIDGKIQNFEQAHQEIRRDFKVHKLGIAYLPVAGRIAFEGKSFVVDYTNTVPKVEFRLSTVRDNELFTSSVTDLEALCKSAPIVEDSTTVAQVSTDQYSRSIQQVPYYGYMASLDQKLQTVSECLKDLRVSSVSLPVVFPNSPYAQFLNEYSALPDDATTVFPVFDVHQHDEMLSMFQSLNQMKKALQRQSERFEQVLRNLMVGIASTVQTVTTLKIESTDRLVTESNQLMFMILKSSYNHYSPRLEAEEIERIRNESFNYQDSAEGYTPFQLKASSRVFFDPVSGIWFAEDGSKTAFPFGMQQIHEEIVAPIVQNLLEESRAERMRIYNGIQDQKNDYLNQWHRDTEDFYGRNRAESSNLTSQMRSTFTDFLANYNTLQALENTEQQMVSSGNLSDSSVSSVNNEMESVSAYELKKVEYQRVQDEFAEYVERLKEDIDRRAEKFRYMEYYDASLRDSLARSMAVAETKTQQLDERRKPLLAVNPLFAESSQLPPAPTLERLAEEHGALNLPALAKSAIQDIDAMENA